MADHYLLPERTTFAQNIQSLLPIEMATALALTDFVLLVGAGMTKVASFTPSPGYEPHFVAADMPAIAAHGLAYLARRHGRRVAREAKHYEGVADAIRFLTKGRQKAAIDRRARHILKAWRETSVVENLFYVAGLQESEFICLLEKIESQESTDYERLQSLAAQMLPHLLLRRGPKVSAPSAAHAFLLEHELPAPPKRRSYSRNNRAAENVDALTEATRIEFQNPKFDSRPTKRLSKRAKR